MQPINKLLTSLGSNSSQVAETLTALHCLGYRNRSFSHPIITFLDLERKESYKVENDNVVRCPRRDIVITPKAVKDFIKEFNEGKYPKLDWEEKVWKKGLQATEEVNDV